MADMYDVVVIGGGPSGSMAAKTLASAGLKVFLAEKNFKRIKPCGGATPSKSFEEFDLPQKEIVKKVKTISAISPVGFRIDILLKGGYLAMVERRSFDNSLRRRAEEAGADLVEAELLRINKKNSKINITVIEKGRERKILSDFLIAADGVNSRIAKAIGLESLPGVYTIQEKVDLQRTEEFKRLEACEFWFSSSHAPNFYSWVFPKEDYIDIGTGSIHGKHIKNLIKNFKIRRQINSNGTQKAYRVPLKWRDSLVKGNILFVGDAAGLVMPLTYEGIYYAMSSGKMAAEAIIRGNPREYERQWNRTFKKQFKLMKRLRKYFLKNDRVMEQMFNLHKIKKLQEVSLKLWLEKDLCQSSFLSYVNFFRKFLN